MDQTVRGNQPAGPRRWLRAAQWAAARPNTSQARKYTARIEAAEAVAAAGPDREWLHYSDGDYAGQTCSTRCAMLQLQLDLGIAGLTELEARATDDPRTTVQERPVTSPRRGACKVCGGEVAPRT